jgi:hypothetical protein
VQVEEVEVEMANPLHDQARSWLLAIYFRLAVPRSMTRASEADVRVCAGKAGAQGDYDDDRRLINNRGITGRGRYKRACNQRSV